MSLLPLRRGALSILAAFAFCFLPLHAARASHLEFSAGRSYTLGKYWTDVGFIEWLGDARDLGPFRWAPDVSGGVVAGRSSLAANFNRTAWLAAAGARLYFWRGLFGSFQGAVTTANTDALSSTGEFVSSLGWQGKHWLVMARHISNGDLHKPNHGETMFLVGVAF